jgi:flagellar hook assembly protein FlgD
VELITVGVEERSSLPVSHKLYANYPNPFNPTTSIAFDLGEDTYVTLQILDIRGRVVDELVSAHMKRGNYRVKWNGELQERPADAGVYFYRLSTQNSDLVRKMTLLK